MLANARRAPGRPSRISRAQVVAASLQLLESDGLPAFTRGKLAKAVGVSVMALYTYFPSRSVLLDAAAESLFAQFQVVEPAADWEHTTRDWIHALHQGFAERPIALKLIRWEQHLAPAWLRVWLPMVHALATEGLGGERLLFACSWLSSAVVGSIQVSLSAVAERDPGRHGRTGRPVGEGRRLAKRAGAQPRSRPAPSGVRFSGREHRARPAPADRRRTRKSLNSLQRCK